MLYGEWIKWDKDPKTNVWGPVPEMIASWDIKPNAATFKLQPGIKFHDGTPWDAAAAKWNLDRMIFDPAATIRSYFAAVDQSKEDQTALANLKTTAAQNFDYASKAVEIVDSMTVKVNCATPMVSILSLLSNVMWCNNPVSPTAYKKLGKAAFNRAPVGAGPFRFVEWVSGDHLTLERNPDYWKKSADGQQLPYLDKITYRLIVDDSVRLLSVKSGDIHVTELVQGKDIAGIKTDSSVTYIESQSSGNHYRYWVDAGNPNNPLTKSAKLRQSMLYAIDRAAMLQTLGFGAGGLGKYLMPLGSLAYDDTVPFYAFDQAKAKQLFKDALAETPSLAGADGKVAVSMMVINRAVDTAQAEMIKQMAEAVGFSVTIQSLDRATVVSKLQSKAPYDMVGTRNPVIPGDPDADWRLYFYSTGPSAYGHLNIPAWDKLIDQGSSTSDEAQRKTIYRQLAMETYQQGWFAYLWIQNWNWLLSKRVTGFKEPLTNRHMYTEVSLA